MIQLGNNKKSIHFFYSIIFLLLGVNASFGQTVVNFTTPGTTTWTCPTGVNTIQVEAWGGGGGGAGSGSSTNLYSGGGGAGGNYVKNTNLSVTPGNTYTIIVGSGGNGGSNTGTANNVPDLNGGTSSFGALLYASGGQGGAGGTTAIKQGIGGGNAGILAYNITSAGSGYSATPTVTVGAAWTANTTYSLNQQYFNAGKLYTVTTAGSSGTVAPTHTNGFVTATGGTATFTYAGLAATAAVTLTGTTPNKTVSAVIPVTTGSGYLTTPIVTISAGNATITAASPASINVTGSTFYALGGSGGNGTYVASSTNNSSGGGGASGGPLGSGNNGVGTVGGASVSGSGAGANGVSASGTAGNNAGLTEYGGGGSGGVGASKTGGAGAAGKVTITYTTSYTTLTAPLATASTSPTQTGFTANWNAVSNASSYSLSIYNANTQSNIVGWTFPVSGTTLTADITSTNNLTNTLVQSSGTVNTDTGATTQAISAASWYSTSNKYWEVPVNTTGYFNVNVSSKIYSTAPKDFKLQYKIGSGGTYTDVTNGAIVCATDWTTGVLTNLTLPAECNNQPSVYLRWINYTNIDFSTGLPMTGGTARLDDVYIKGALLTLETGFTNPISVSNTSTSQVITGLATGVHYYDVVALGNGSSYLDSVRSNLITSVVSIPQSIADYKTVGDATTAASTNWQYYDGANWNAATAAPTSTNNITVSSGNTVVVSADFSIAAGKTMTVIGTINLSGKVISGAGSFVLNSGASLKLGDNASITDAITATTTTLSSAANYYFDGTVAQHTGGLPNSVAGTPSASSGAVTYTATLTGNVTISNAVGVTMQQAIKINSPGSITVTSAGKLLFGDGEVATSPQYSGSLNSGSYNINGSGSFVAQTGCTLSITSSKGISGATDGNIRNTTRTFGSLINYIFAKNDLMTPISIGTSFGSEINATTGINNLTINDPYGVFLASAYTTSLVGTANTASAATTSTYTSGADITVNGTLNMISGKLYTSDYVTVATNSATPVNVNAVDYYPVVTTVVTPGTTNTKTITIAASGSISGAGSARWIVGNLAKQTASGANPSYSYPIGDATNYTPVALTFSSNNSAASAGSITARTTSGDHASIASSGLDASKSVNRTFTLTNNGVAGFANYSAAFNYASADNDNAATPANYIVRRYASAAWNTVSTPTSVSSTSIVVDGITGFGDFAIGETTGLPSFSTQPQSTSICAGSDASFTAASSTTMASIIKWQRSTDGTTWTDITANLDAGTTYSGFNSGTLVLTGAASSINSYQYKAVCTTINGSVDSNSATLTVNSVPAAPTAAAQNFCNAATVADLTATGSSIQWYAAATGGTALASSTALTTATYYASQTSNSCESARTSVAVNVNPLPTFTLGFVDDVLPTDTSFTIPYTATTGSPNQYSLTTAATGGSSIAMPNFTPVSNATLGSTPITVTIPASAAAEYGFNLTVTNSTTGCSQVYPFQFHVTSVSHGVIGSDQTICSGATPAPLTNITSGSSTFGSITYTWEQSTTSVSTGYSTISGETGEGYTPGALTQTTFFKRVTHYAGTNPDVASDSDPVTITVNTSVGGSVGGSTAICSGSTSGVLTLSGHSGSIVRWESAVSPFTSWTTISNTATTYTSGALTETTKFRAVVNNNSCGEVNATPATISISTTTYDGTSWSNGDPDSTKAAIFTGNYTIAADFTACSLRVTNNAVVSVSSNYNVNLNGSISVDSGSSFTMNNNSNLFQSDATAVNTGNIIVKRNTSNIVRLDHTLWSSPVTGQNLFSFSPNTLVNRFYVYNTATNSYVTTGLSNTSLFTPAKGFAVRAPNNQSATTPAQWTGTFTGVPNNGTKTFTLATDAANGYNYNLVGNPYPSALSASDFYAANSSKIGGTLYFYAHTLTMNASGLFPTGTNYATWTGLGGAAATAGDGHTSAVAPNGIIQVGQGFIVKATAAGDVTFTNAMRVANQQNQFMKAATTTAETHRMWLNLKTDTGVDINQILVGYMDGATQGVDADLDGLSFGNTGSYLYSKIENNNYVIQARSLPFDTTDEVPLGFNCATAGSYSISLTNTDGLFAGSQDVLVRDNLTGTDTSIKTTPYTFTSEAGVFDTRFKLVYQQALGVPSTNFTENSVIVYKNTDWFHVTTKGIEMKDIMVYDISGRLIYSQKDINATTAVLNGLSTTNQVLMLKITSQEGKTVTIKVIN
jgi:hypothetical protein